MQGINNKYISEFENAGCFVFEKLVTNRFGFFSQVREDFLSLLKDYSEGELVNPTTKDSSSLFSYEFEKFGISYFGCPPEHRYTRGKGSVYKEENKNWLFGKNARLNLLNNPSLLWRLLNDNILTDIAKKCLKTNKLSFLGAHLGSNYPGANLYDRSFFTTTGMIIQDQKKTYSFNTKPFNILTILVPLDNFKESNSPIIIYPKSHQQYHEINNHVVKYFKERVDLIDYTFQPNIPHQFKNSFENKYTGAYDKNLFFGNTLYRELLPQNLSKPKRLIAEKGDIIIIDGRMLLEYGSNTSQETTRFVKFYFSSVDLPSYASHPKQNITDLINIMLYSRNNSIKYQKYNVKNVIKNSVYNGLCIYHKAKNRNYINFIKRKLSISATKKINRKSVIGKMYLNIGSGSNWNHNEVVALDIGPMAEVSFNLESNKPLPFDNNRFLGITTSHVIEHLKESTAITIMKEAYRILQPGGVLRIIVPDILEFFNAYNNNIEYFNWIRRNSSYRYDSWLRLIVRSFAEPIVDKYSDDELYMMYNKMDLVDYLNTFTKEVDLFNDKKLLGPNHHKSWHSLEKFNSILSRIGFSKVVKVSENESHVEIFTGSRFNQRWRKGPNSIQRIHQSLFVEGIK